MNNSQIILAVALSGLFGGLIANLILPVHAPPPLVESDSSTLENPTSSSLERALDSLRQENQEFRGRLMALENREPADRRSPLGGAVSKAEFDSLEQEVRGKQSLPVDSGVFEEKVASALSEIRLNEQIEKAVKGQERWSEHLEERVSRVSDWLVLDSYQTEQYRVALQSKDRRNEELIQTWQDGTPRAELGGIKASNASQHIGELAVFFSPGQLETYAARVGGGKN